MKSLAKALWGAVVLAAMAVAPAAVAQTYPTKPVRVVAGFPPGQATDVLGRAVMARLQESTGQQFYVDNKPGAAGIIATQAVMQAPPDGYTLLLSSSGPLAVNPGLYSKLPYDPEKDFVPVAGIASVPLVLIVNPSFPPKSVKELVDYARAHPGEVNYASGGQGVTNHLVMEMFRSAANIQLTHVPYKGGPPALTDLASGQVQVMFETTTAALPFVRQGRMRALGVSTVSRITAAPELPTIAESGYPGFSGVPWVAIMAPAHTPDAIVKKLNAEINKALESPEVKQYFLAQGAEPMVMSPDQLGKFLKVEIGKWSSAVKASGAKVE
ncbi:MAG: tripartite tricarboxylate transporter substrate binding protein [Gammaproteobacteria bacterium]|nr:tripartite tricarboxylate transporter substrate binding protein [Gammaproteobacteria bacterium]MBU1440362.1 tripartite tricarboxylate transporter substrate binding protein [Gammaproteobacteria bacterium]MBU2288177.1 tripartite tricarboxylate transporter substrate binding protein [Gammaproteobacteria bacterium]MBU2407815.1 tripartite tricarboxylate transporter substrate binding protein [Gammaproteobacteria bacterium]